jgi:hypothetical protein
MTNHLYFATVLLSFVLGVTCNNQQQSNNEIPLNLTVQIKGCAAETITKSSVIITDSITHSNANPFEISGDTLMYQRTLKHLCCRKVKVSATMQANTIKIEERWYGLGCKCQCVSTVEAIVLHVKAGDYRAIVIESGTDPITDKPNANRDTIWNGKIKMY